MFLVDVLRDVSPLASRIVGVRSTFAEAPMRKCAAVAADESFANSLVQRLSLVEQRATADRASRPSNDYTPACRAAVTRGLQCILAAAQADSDKRALSGLALLSYAAADDGFEVSPLPPAACVRPDRRVGRRDVVNEPRLAVIADVRRAHADSPTLRLRQLGRADGGSPTRAVQERAQVGSDGFPKIAASSLSETYRMACLAYGVRANSGLLSSLALQWETLASVASPPDADASTTSASTAALPADAPTAAAAAMMATVRVIDASGLLLADKGVLAVLEVARLCPNLAALHLDGNGLTNAAAEYIADFCLDRCGAPRRDDDPTTEDGARGYGFEPAPTKQPLLVTFAGNPRMSIGAGLVLVEAARVCGPSWLSLRYPVEGTSIPLNLQRRAAILVGSEL